MQASASSTPKQDQGAAAPGTGDATVPVDMEDDDVGPCGGPCGLCGREETKGALGLLLSRRVFGAVSFASFPHPPVRAALLSTCADVVLSAFCRHSFSLLSHSRRACRESVSHPAQVGVRQHVRAAAEMVCAASRVSTRFFRSPRKSNCVFIFCWFLSGAAPAVTASHSKPHDCCAAVPCAPAFGFVIARVGVPCSAVAAFFETTSSLMTIFSW